MKRSRQAPYVERDLKETWIAFAGYRDETNIVMCRGVIEPCYIIDYRLLHFLRWRSTSLPKRQGNRQPKIQRQGDMKPKATPEPQPISPGLFSYTMFSVERYVDI